MSRPARRRWIRWERYAARYDRRPRLHRGHQKAFDALGVSGWTCWFPNWMCKGY